MKKLIIIFIAFSTYEAPAQGGNPFGFPSYFSDSTTRGQFQIYSSNGFDSGRYKMIIQVFDRETDKELGYYSLNTQTNRTSHRGTYISTFTYFFNNIFVPMAAMNAAGWELAKSVSLGDSIRIRQALANYDTTAVRYGQMATFHSYIEF